MSSVNDVVSTWMPQLEYFMEDDNIPSDSREQAIYFRQARSYLSDRFVELFMMTKNHQETGIDRPEAVWNNASLH